MQEEINIGNMNNHQKEEKEEQLLSGMLGKVRLKPLNSVPLQVSLSARAHSETARRHQPIQKYLVAFHHAFSL
jgi:hypothetical protein